MRIGVGAVPMPRSGGPAGVVHADEHDTTVAVGQTHHGIHQVVVAERLGAFGQKLGGELFTAGEQAANVGVGQHDPRRAGVGESGRGGVGKLPARRTRSIPKNTGNWELKLMADG